MIPPFLPAFIAVKFNPSRFRVPLLRDTKPPSSLDIIPSNIAVRFSPCVCDIVISTLSRVIFDGKGNVDAKPLP